RRVVAESLVVEDSGRAPKARAPCHPLITSNFFFIQIITAIATHLCRPAQKKGWRGVCPGEGCGGRERSEAVRNEVEHGSEAHPVASPTPLLCLALRSAAAGAPHNGSMQLIAPKCFKFLM
ncbi:MAG: hypothetical protein NZM35_09455, partial [Chitinophagales bacterium]|nr:hypothetical protein [Chitinophagales bacterium]